MRIHPICSIRDHRLLRTLEVPRIPAEERLAAKRAKRVLEFCPPKPIKHAIIHPIRVLTQGEILELLLRQAYQGILRRMQSFDWQIVHGHKVSGGDGPNAFLDIQA